jgi:membrane-bound lytic murein transglycosylase MltF
MTRNATPVGKEPPIGIARIVGAAVLGLMLATSAQAQTAPATAPAKPSQRALGTTILQRTGDFDMMFEHRVIRVGVPYSRTLYYHDAGRERGLTAEAVRHFETFINKKHRKNLAKRPITVALIPTTRDELIPDLIEGRIDIAAGNITITESRRAQVDFTRPNTKPFSEIIVTGPRGPALKTLDDLAGKEVFARPTTSYYESLTALNEKFRAAGKPLMKITKLPDPIEDEDKLDMVNAGLLGPVVVDEWLGKLWKPILPNIVLHEDLAVREQSEIGWAFRRDSPKLAAEIDDFKVKVADKIGMAVASYKQFAAKVRKARGATNDAEMKRFQSLVTIFRKYGERYHFDYLMLTAQGFQESQLNQEARSHVGAIGVMQLMPATGAEMKVGDIKAVENNIHAGTKYMDQLMITYFPHEELDEANRTLFAFAAYNAGPGRVARLRKQAEKEGYDPNKWFNNVERVVAKKVGQEPVTYVRNIYKYYISYRLAVEAEEEAKAAAAEIKTAPAKP